MARKPTTDTATPPADLIAPPPADARPTTSTLPTEGGDAESAGPSDPEPTVVVTALQPSRWRIGRHFGAEPVSIPAEELSEDEFAALKADPLLSIQIVGAPY